MSRRRRRGHEEEEHVNHERWMASYMDMVTVMMCLFIVLYAIGQVDQAKFIELKTSLAASFGAPSASSVEVVDGGRSVLTSDAIVPAEEDLANHSGGAIQSDEHTAGLQAARAEVNHLDELREEIHSALEQRSLGGDVTFKISERGLIVGLVSGDVFFSAESADLTPVATAVVDVLAGLLVTGSEEMSVEGHANNLPTIGRYATNWELSSARATTVLRRMVEVGHVAPGRIRAVGFGDAHPVDPAGEDPLFVNRRVDVVILSDAPESVRSLIPQVVSDLENGE